MAHGVDATKTPDRPSHEAVENPGDETRSELDKVALQAAKRANNRISQDETKIPGSSEFTH